LLDIATKIHLNYHESFVSRAGEKLSSVVDIFKLDFTGKLVLDVGVVQVDSATLPLEGVLGR